MNPNQNDTGTVDGAIRRRVDGSIDTGYYVRRAASQRSNAIRETLGMLRFVAQAARAKVRRASASA